MVDFLTEIGLDPNLFRESESGTVVYDIYDVDEYGRIWTILDTSDIVTEDPESSTVQETLSNIQFASNDPDRNFIVTLKANFADDEYSITCKEFN